MLIALTMVSALGCGLVAGVFFAFSTFVMKALARLPGGAGIAAMQSINVAVLNPWFLAAFLGTGVCCVLAMGAAFTRWSEPDSVFLALGGAIYLAGTFGVTFAFNVPRNAALAILLPDDRCSADQWANYVSGWTAWNHLRTAAALAAAAAFTAALTN